MVDGYGVVTVSKDVSGRITVSFPYDLQLVTKVKTIGGRKWHKDKRYWSFPDTDGTVEKILKAFEGEKICIAPDVQNTLPYHVIARSEDSSPVIASHQRWRSNLKTDLLTKSQSLPIPVA